MKKSFRPVALVLLPLLGWALFGLGLTVTGPATIPAAITRASAGSSVTNAYPRALHSATTASLHAPVPTASAAGAVAIAIALRLRRGPLGKPWPW